MGEDSKSKDKRMQQRQKGRREISPTGHFELSKQFARFYARASLRPPA
jgi:hypothetical protein